MTDNDVMMLAILGGVVAAYIAAEWQEWRRKRAVQTRREALATCQHPRETLTTGGVLEWRCVDCGNARHVGYVWMGASNRGTRRSA